MLGMCKKFCGKEECIECYEKSFASHPRSKMWSERNSVKPFEISKWSRNKFEFKCNLCNHYFSSILNHVSRGSWCPYCSHQILCNDENCKLCFEKSFASHEKSKYWSKENKIDSRYVFKHTNKKYIFDCCHKFEISPNNLLNGNYCPYCSNPPKKLCNDENCKLCFEKSFASHEKSKYWSKENKILPREIIKSSYKKYKFDCCHKIEISLNNITGGKWCSYCCDPPKKLCNDENCKLCFEKSFASHEKSKYWDYEKNKLIPREVFKNCNDKFNFHCDICSHNFKSTLSNITKRKGCPYCVQPSKLLCCNEDCNFCFEKSLASCIIEKEWGNNIIIPRNIFKGSPDKFNFICTICQKIYQKRVSHYTTGSRCPYCINKSEKKFYDYILQLYSCTIYQYKPDWCVSHITSKFLPFDFYVPSLKLIVEIDGPQHFRQISNWSAPEHTQSKDLYKMKKAYNQGISVIRIPYEFIFYNEKFKEYTPIISQNLVLREKPEIIYLCNDDRYDHFKKYNFDTDEVPEIISEKDVIEV
jgi:hypothetical protein